MICPICDRPLDENFNEHHLIPRTFKGTEVVNVHRICHNQLHALWSEREMLNYYHTVERMLSDERLQKFVAWVKKKPIDFYQKTKDSNERKKRR
jgi:hypothetical protein